MNNIDVTVTIVCMNNLKNLYPCLDSIKKHTTVSFETLVVAYLFSDENLQKLKADYPWITIIKSNEIRGFSENNNLALRQAKGKYCFVLNDDTLFDMPVIDYLLKTFEILPEQVAIVSPKLLYADGRLQYCGQDKFNWKTFLQREFSVNPKEMKISPYVNQEGVFQTINILGAAFLIKTAIFREIDFFDETYFFVPEDTALSTELNKRGYKCYVNSDVHVYHLEGGTWSDIRTATMPAKTKGEIIFVSQGSSVKKYLIISVVFSVRLFKYAFWKIKHLFYNSPKAKIMAKANKNICLSIFSNKTPKEIFMHYYKPAKK